MSAPSSVNEHDARIAREEEGWKDARMQPLRDAFDQIASSYDHKFTNSVIGRLQREAVWNHLDSLFSSGNRILDLGCGTGADAIYLAARGLRVHGVDISEQMVAEAERAFADAGLSERISTEVMAIEDLPAWDGQSCLSTSPPQAYDGAISNFGALNCVHHLRPVAEALGRLIHPGGHLAVNLISPFCLWETASLAIQGKFAKAARRWTNQRQATASLNGSATFPVYYHPVRKVVKAFEPEFRLRHHHGIGILVPPSYLEKHARRFRELTRFAAKIDRAISAWPVYRATADHTLLVFTRNPAI